MDDHSDTSQEFFETLLRLDALSDTAAGIARQAADRGYESLSDKQRYVIDNELIELGYAKNCARGGCEIPWEERIEVPDNGGLCGYCAHMRDRSMDE